MGPRHTLLYMQTVEAGQRAGQQSPWKHEVYGLSTARVRQAGNPPGGVRLVIRGGVRQEVKTDNLAVIGVAI